MCRCVCVCVDGSMMDVDVVDVVVVSAVKLIECLLIVTCWVLWRGGIDF